MCVNERERYVWRVSVSVCLCACLRVCVCIYIHIYRLHMPEGLPAPSSDIYASTILNECRDVPLALSYILAE